MTIIEKEAIQKKIGNAMLFAENVGAALDLQHGLVAELEAQCYNIDYKDTVSKKENARELSKLARELDQLKKNYKDAATQVDELKAELADYDNEDKAIDKDEKEMERAIELAIKLWTNPKLKTFIKEMTAELLSSTFEALKAAELVTRVELVGESQLKGRIPIIS